MSNCPICKNILVVNHEMPQFSDCNFCDGVFDTMMNQRGKYIESNPCENNTIECFPEKGMLTCALCKKEWCVECVVRCDVFEQHGDKFDTFLCKFCNKKYLS